MRKHIAMLTLWAARKFELKRNRIIISLGLVAFMLIVGDVIFNRQIIAAIAANVAVQMHPMENGPAMVQIPGKDYKIGKYEVTQKEWRDVMGNNPSYLSNCGDTCPVEMVSWNDAHKFIQMLNKKSGRHFRLPTEAEWKNACYGGNKTKYCGGNDIDRVAWYLGNSIATTHPVGQKQANGYGLYDMSGNVSEWVEDKVGNEHNLRVLLGGAWDADQRDADSGVAFGAENDSINLGFRLAESNSATSDTDVASGVSVTVVASSPSIYSIEEIAEDEIDEEENRHRLVANIDGEELKGPAAPILFIDKEADFNGDGVMDALVSTSRGGNCCPSTYMIVSVNNGEVVASELDSDWGEYPVIEKNGRLLIEHVTDEETTFYAYGKDFEVAVVKTIPHRVLKAEKEIYGEGNLYTGTDLERTLKADLNKDGKKEEIICMIWTRWGLLTNCNLPLPDGSSQTSEVQCHRFGILNTSRNGYRELVCDNNTVVYFDGEKWATDEK